MLGGNVDNRADVEFDRLFRGEHPKLVALALVLTGHREAAADIAQEALVRAYRSWAAVGKMERPGAWARRVTINLATDWHRNRGREHRAFSRLDSNPTMSIADPESDQFWRAVRELPERQRAAVALHYLEDLSVSDVARVLDIAEGTVKASLFKARATLSRSLAKEDV
jgi:RNA polymerase sigma-70 factor, ECF subfamily